MCGIAVIQGENNSALLHSMMESIKHRGPNGRGTFFTNNISMGHVRLSIIDIQSGNQPIFNEDHDKCIVFNGEIYNYKQLRESLRPRHRFTTNSDTEVILHLYEEHAENCVHYLDGMFAFAIYDNGNLFLARDRIGIKPLYYGLYKDSIILFASEIKALHDCDKIKEIPPGHLYTSSGGLRTYFSIPRTYQSHTMKPDANKIINQIRTWLIRAVEKRLVADVPVAVFLSGGIDSSIIAALMRKNIDDLYSFAVGMKGSFDLQCAREVASYLGTRHFEYIFTIDDMLNALPRVIYHLESFDAPLVRSAIPNYFVAHLAHNHVKVVLTGEGSDELFSGYHYLKTFQQKNDLYEELYDITTRLYNTNLQRTDRMTMAHSVEARIPFLDSSFVDLAFSIPIELKQVTNERMEKWLLRKAFENYLPEHIVWRTKQKFSEGAGSMDIIESFAESTISDEEYALEISNSPVSIRSKEELYYYKLYREQFGQVSAKEIVGRTMNY